jgi:ABC-type transport system involved in cytochrome bd biosynthesis fused ATPase/permease subunit
LEEEEEGGGIGREELRDFKARLLSCWLVAVVVDAIEVVPLGPLALTFRPFVVAILLLVVLVEAVLFVVLSFKLDNEFEEEEGRGLVA